MEDDSPGLSVGFAIETGGSFQALGQLSAAMDTAEERIVREAASIERATSAMINTARPTAEIIAFGSAATRELASSARAKAATEKAGESLIRQLDREAAAFGKTRDEMRSAKVEALAFSAAQQGNTDLAERLQASEAGLYDMKFAAARKARFEVEAAAEDQQQAASQAVAAAAQQAQALREAAFAHQMFEAAARKGAAALREVEAAERATASAAEAQSVREAALAYQMFEAAARKGAAAMREQEAAEKAGAMEARAQEARSAAAAYQMFEARAREGMAAFREHEAAVERDAAAVAELRAMIDPAAAAQDRLNAELAEARRVMTAAGASAQELAAAEDALWARSTRATQQHDLMANAARKNGSALQSIALQLPDITQGLLTGQKPMTVFIQQGFQIVQVAQMAEGGLRGFGQELAGLAVRFAPILVGLAAAGAGFALFNRWINEGVTNDQLTRDLGKITGGADATKQELFKLKDATITWADTSKALFAEVGKDVAKAFVGDMASMGKDVKTVLDDMTSYGRASLAGLYAGVAGTKAYLGEIEKGGLLGVGKMLIGQGDPDLLKKTYGAAYDVADKYLTSLGARVKKAAVENARARLAESIGFNNLPKPKVDRHAEQLAREAEATEAQIRNLYRLADAYGVSGGAALIAEAQTQAESKAIKQGADIKAAVDRQVQLAIAQRVGDAGKSAASARQQADIQAEMNGMVAAGNIPAERAAELVRDRIADLPLLAAIEAAQQRGLKTEADRATKALQDQHAAQAATAAAGLGQRFTADDAAADRQLAMLREELRLVGATEAVRARGLALLRATQDADAKFGAGTAFATDAVAKQMQIYDATVAVRDATADLNGQLTMTADRWHIIASKVQSAGQGMADAFGEAGRAIGDVASIFTTFQADRSRAEQQHAAALKQANTAEAKQRENALFALRSSGAQIEMYGDLAGAAKGFFKEGSTGYKAMAAAEKVYRVAQLAMSLQAMIQNVAETTASVAGSAARATAAGAEGVAHQAKLPFPANIAAMAATAAALVAAGIAVVGGRGGSSAAPVTNTGTGTVLGDPAAKSESIARSIDALKEVDTLMLTASRQMAASLKSIDSQIGGVAAQLVRSGNIDASAGVTEGFKTNAVGSVLKAVVPIFGGALASLFGTKTEVVGSGLSAGPQTIGSILGGGFDAQTYSDILKTKKFLGITTGKSTSTQYAAADSGLENQFTLILKSFNTAIAAAAGPLGESTAAIQGKLNGFVVDLGKIELKGLTGTQIQEKLEAVFGAAADGMAKAAFPGIEQLQKVGEGAFETLVRVASTVEAVTASLDLLGGAAAGVGVNSKLALADQFDSIGDLTSAADAYFQAFYTKEEQAAAKTQQMARVFDSLGMTMPATIAGFRELVEAQDLTTQAGGAAYATLLQLAPAFADLKTAMDGAKSTADILSERQDLERQLLQLRGDTAAIRALDLAKVDASNRALQQQVWAVQDAQEAAKAADELRQAWSSVGDSIMDEVKRIRGLTDTAGGGSFASLMGQFNAATTSARGGDQDAAKSLPALSQALLKAAGEQATSRQELARVQAQTAASLEATYGVIGSLTAAASNTASSNAALLTAAASTQAATSTAAANDDMATEIRALKVEIAQMRDDNNKGHAATAGNVAKVSKTLDSVTEGGDAIRVASAA